MKAKQSAARVFATVAMALAAPGGLRLAGADEWQLAFEEGFASKDWPTRWTLLGSVGPTEPGAVRSAGGELTAWIKQEFKAPAIRVEYEARMAAADRAGKISDLSCFIGASPEDSGTVASCGFQFGAEDNTEGRITFPGMTPAVEKRPLIERGKWHRLVAEVNGRAASLAVDGRRVATALLPEDLPAGFVRLYSWAGMAEFRRVKVYTKEQTDPIPEEMKAAEVKRLADPPQQLKPWRHWSVPPVSDVKPSPIARQRVALTVDNPSAYRGPWPITVGFPVPKDTRWDIRAVRLVDGTGKEVPEGTVEFFVRLNTNPDLLGAEGLPMRLPLNDSVPRSAEWIDSLLRWEYKSSVMVGDGVMAEVPGRLCASAWDHANSPTVLRAGRWYHLAAVWKLNDGGRLTCYTYLNGEPYPMGDFDLSVWDWRQPALRLVLPGPALQVGALPGVRAARYDFRLDELRISDIIRYPHHNRRELMVFQPPQAPLQPDAHTLLLFHFDGDTVGLAGPEGKQIEAKFENRP